MYIKKILSYCCFLVLFFVMLFASPLQAFAGTNFHAFVPAQLWNFQVPDGIAVDSSGNVYVTDTYSNRIEKFNSTGAFQATWGSTGSGDGQFYGPDGIAVDSGGNVYVADTPNNRIEKFDSAGTFQASWGSLGSGDGQFYQPNGIAVDSSGNVYVADTENNRIEKFDSAGTFQASWGSTGGGVGQFNRPNGIAVDSSGNVYVVDTENNRIEKFDSAGTFLAVWGSSGNGEGQFQNPYGIGSDSFGNVYVTDTGNGRIEKFDSTGTFQASWGSLGSADGQFETPHGIVVDSFGNVYVTDIYNVRIEKFDSTGAFQATWGSTGSGDGQFNSPNGIAVDGFGNVYVADTNNNRIEKFDSLGTFQASWGSGQFQNPIGITVDSFGNVYVADTGNNQIKKYDSTGTLRASWGSFGCGDGQFVTPFGIAVDSFGNVYVTDTNNNRIEKFDSTGTFQASWGSTGSGDGQFNRPNGIAVDSFGNVYVADTNNNRIEKFDSTGTFQATWGSTGSGVGQFDYPFGIAVDSGGNVYVADTNNNRIEKFDSTGTFQAAWGSLGSGDGQFDCPFGIALDSSGNVYVADTDNNRIQRMVQAWNVSIGSLTGGSITASPTAATSGSAINLTITPDPGMQLKSGTLKYNDGTTDSAISGKSFTMPAANVTVSAEFEAAPVTLQSITTPSAISGVANGTAKTAIALDLPSIVTIVTDQGNLTANVIWDVNSCAYDASETDAQTFIVRGTVTLPTGVLNPNNVPLTISISVSINAGSSSNIISAPTLQSAATDSSGTQIILNFNKAMSDPGNSAGAFYVNVSRNGQSLQESITQTKLGSDSTQIILSMSKPLLAGDSISASCTPSAITSADGGIFSGFSNQAVMNQAPQPLPISAGQTAVTVSSAQTNLALTPETVNSAGNTPISITVLTGVNNATLNVANLVQTSSGSGGNMTTTTMPAINISAAVNLNSASSTPVNVQIQIPQGTMVGAPAGWNGTINLPTVQAVSSVASILAGSGTTATVDSVIEVGYGNVPLTFSRAVRIRIPGQAGKKVGYVRNGTLYPINTVLSADDQSTADSSLGVGQDSYLNVGSDLVIWTKHFTQYVTYTVTTNSSGGNGSHGGGVSGGASTTPATTAAPTTPTSTGSNVQRLYGQNQVDTSLAIARAEYPNKVSNVVLATADNYPDALAGSVLAYKLNAPILLVGSSEADEEKVLDYMKSNLDPSGNVYILGGTAVVSADMEAKIKADGFSQITRLGGTDRYETAVKIANQLQVKSGTPIVLAYGENYPDALSISSIAAKNQYPILLVQNGGLSDVVKNEITAIKPSKVYIIGGDGVISSAVERQVERVTSLDKTNIIRIAGQDRFDTSLAVAQYFNLDGQRVCIATGNNFPDALAGSVYAANHNTSIILADGSLSDQVVNYLKGKKLTGATIFGGEAAVSQGIEQRLGQLIGK